MMLRRCRASIRLISASIFISESKIVMRMGLIVVSLSALTAMELGTPSPTKTNAPDPIDQLTVNVSVASDTLEAADRIEIHHLQDEASPQPASPGPNDQDRDGSCRGSDLACFYVVVQGSAGEAACDLHAVLATRRPRRRRTRRTRCPRGRP